MVGAGGAGGGVCVWAGEMVRAVVSAVVRAVEMAGGVCVCAGVWEVAGRLVVVMEVGGDGGWEVRGRWLVGGWLHVVDGLPP